MIPTEPTPEQRRRDGRLAWVLVGCSAVATLVLVVVGLWALGGPLARGLETMAATNSAPASNTAGEADKASPDAEDVETNLAGDNAADLPAVDGEVRKRSAGEQDSDDGASVRRGEGPREEREDAPARRPTPIA